MKNPEGGPVCRCSTQDGVTRRTRCSVGEVARRSGVIYLESWPVWEPLYVFGAGDTRPGMGSGGEFLEGLLRVSFRRFGPDYGRCFGNRMWRTSCLASNGRVRGIGPGMIAYNDD